MDRRRFLSLSAGALAAYGQEKPKRVGLIGTGWYGKSDLFRLIQVAPVEVVSLCDVDKTMLSNCADMVAQRQVSKKRPRTYANYQEMLREGDLDMLLIGTPDHWHALPFLEACKSGVDIYCQKPVSVDVTEGLAMLNAARKYKRVVQIGTQRRSTPHLIEARDEIIKTGKLGKIAYVEVYCYYHMRAKDRPATPAVPSELDYEMWTGPAPMRPWNGLQHPRRWRAFEEYGNGIMGDMCVHMLDMVRWMMDLGWPVKISSTGGILIDPGSVANIPDTQEATFDFGEVKVIWTHRSWGHPPDPKYPWGATFYGEKGTLKTSVMSYDFEPLDKGQKSIHRDVKMELEEYPIDKTEKDLERHVAPAIRGHMKDWLAAIEKRSKPVADIEQGFISSASCILANLAMKTGRTLRYDPVQHVVTGDSEATKLLTRAYRKPWQHPDPKKV